MSQRDQSISRWLEECDSDSEDQRDVPEIPNEDCSDVEDVPVDHDIDGECQSDSDIDVDELSEDNDNLPVDNDDLPVDDDAFSDDDVPLARYPELFRKKSVPLVLSTSHITHVGTAQMAQEERFIVV